MKRTTTTTLAVLITASLSGCAIVAPRYTVQQAATLSDREICLLGLQTTSLHADHNMLLQEYNGRLLARRFTHQQCIALQTQQRAANQAAYNAVDSAALGDLAFQLGEAIGSRGRGTPNYAPIAPNKPYAPAAPHAPVPPTYYLITQTVSKTFNNKVCAYGGTSAVIIVQPYEPCPASMAR